MSSIKLTFGAGQIDRVIPNGEELLIQYRNDTGCFYQDYQPFTPNDRVVPEDLAVTLLVNSQVGWRAFHSLIEQAYTIDLSLLPKKPLEQTSSEEREQVAALIGRMARFPGFAASIATKVLHKKRPDLIPILDNQAIFGAYMNPDWPVRPARTESIKNPQWILNAFNWIAFDINRSENEGVWDALLGQGLEKKKRKPVDPVPFIKSAGSISDEPKTVQNRAISVRQPFAEQLFAA